MSVSKDNTFKVWSTDSWNCIFTSNHLQSDRYGSGLYKCARWSPDGSMLCITHAIYVHFPSLPHPQKQYPVSLLLKRNTWTPQVVLAGHAGIVGTCRYAPRLLQSDKGDLLQLVGIGCDVRMEGNVENRTVPFPCGETTFLNLCSSSKGRHTMWCRTSPGPPMRVD